MVMKKEKKNNMFDSLYDSEEEEKDISSKGVLIGWAAVVAKPAPRVASLPIKEEECVAIAPAPAAMKTNVSVRVTKSWCEMMDEDSDEEDW